MKRIDGRMFNCIKTLIAGGGTRKEIAEYMQVSEVTVRRIDQAETLEEYENMVAAISISAKQQVKAKQARMTAPQPVQMPVYQPAPAPAPQQPAETVVRHEHQNTITMVANHYMMEQLQQQTEYLKLISNKLAFIVDELTTTKKGDITA